VFCLRYRAFNARAPYCHLWPVRLYTIFPQYLINGTIKKKKKETLLNVKCVFWFSLQFLSETFLILRRIHRDTVCPTRYRTRHFCNNFTVSQQLGALQTHTTDTFLFISHTTNVLLFKFRCNIFIGVRMNKEMPGSVASGTHCSIIRVNVNRSACKVPDILVRFQWKLNVLNRFLKNTPVTNLIEIRPVRAESHADGQVDGQAWRI